MTYEVKTANRQQNQGSGNTWASGVCCNLDTTLGSTPIYQFVKDFPP